MILSVYLEMQSHNYKKDDSVEITMFWSYIYSNTDKARKFLDYIYE